MLLDNFSRPSWYIGALVALWGTVMTCNGFVRNYAGLVVVRFFLGLFEYVTWPVMRLRSRFVSLLILALLQSWLLSGGNSSDIEMVPPRRDTATHRSSLYIGRHRWCLLRLLWRLESSRWMAWGDWLVGDGQDTPGKRARPMGQETDIFTITDLHRGGPLYRRRRSRRRRSVGRFSGSIAELAYARGDPLP